MSCEYCNSETIEDIVDNLVEKLIVSRTKNEKNKETISELGAMNTDYKSRVAQLFSERDQARTELEDIMKKYNDLVNKSHKSEFTEI